MTVAAFAVLALLARQPQCWRDRKLEPEAKALQLSTIAAAIAEVSETPERAAELVAIGYQESRWCLDVGAGTRRGGRGEGYWQLEGSHHGPGPRSGLTLEETTSAARLAAAQLGRSRQCHAGLAGVFTAYAGRPCWQAVLRGPCSERGCEEGWPTLDARVKGYWWALYALRKAGAT